MDLLPKKTSLPIKIFTPLDIRRLTLSDRQKLTDKLNGKLYKDSKLAIF